MTTRTAPESLVQQLERASIAYELIGHPRTTSAAAEDRRLCENEWVVLEARTHEQSLRLRAADLVELSGARLADLSQD